MKSLFFWQQTFESFLQQSPEDDGSHDIGHFRRVWRLAESFSSPHHDRLVILAACYFHDIVSYPKNHPNRSRSSLDAGEKAVSILQELNFPLDKLDHTRECIESHSFSANIPTRSKEAEVVQDADRIEALGAIGLARTFYVAGVLRSKLFDPTDPFAENRELNDTKFAVDHFSTKLLKIPAMMKTPKGRREAEKRARVLTDFLGNLESELYLGNFSPNSAEGQR